MPASGDRCRGRSRQAAAPSLSSPCRCIPRCLWRFCIRVHVVRTVPVPAWAEWPCRPRFLHLLLPLFLPVCLRVGWPAVTAVTVCLAALCV